MKKIITIFSLLVVLCPVTAFARTFVHPGINIDKTQLDIIKNKVLAKEDPWYKSYQLMTATSYAKSTYNGGGAGHTGVADKDGTRQRASRDAMAAFYNMIEYYVKKESNPSEAKAHAENAIKILNTWVADIDTTEAEGQLFMLPICSLVAAADLCKLYDGYTESSMAKFREICRKKWLPDLLNYQGQNNWPGWDGPTNQAMLNIGIFLDDEDVYNRAINYYKYGMAEDHPNVLNGKHPVGYGAGRVGFMVFDPERGLTVEIGRDMPHAEIGLTSAAFLCHTAYLQGDDLFTFDDNILLKGMEGWCKYTLTQEIDWTLCNSTGDYFTMASHKTPNRIYGCLHPEAVVLHYSHRLKTPAPYCEAYIKMRGVTSNNWDAACHPVLQFANEDMKNDYDLASKPDAPVTLEAIPGPEHVSLKWKTADWSNVNGSVIERAPTAAGPWTNLFTYTFNVSPFYNDTTVENNKTYFYRVKSVNGLGESPYSSIVKATPRKTDNLPEGWEAFNLDNTADSLKVFAAYNSANSHSFQMKGSGSKWGAKYDNASVLAKKIKGDFTFTAHLNDWYGHTGHNDRWGLCVRPDKDSDSRFFAVGVGDTDSRYSKMIVRYYSGENASWNPSGTGGKGKGNTHSFPDFWYRIVRKGNKYTAYQSGDGKLWYITGDETDIELGNEVYVGFFLCSNTSVNKLSECYISEVTLLDSNGKDVTATSVKDSVDMRIVNSGATPTNPANITPYTKLASSIEDATANVSLTDADFAWQRDGGWSKLVVKKFVGWNSKNGTDPGFTYPQIELWSSVSTKNMCFYQDLDHLPDGHYTFKAKTGPWNKTSSTLTRGYYIFANDDKTEVINPYIDGVAQTIVTTLVTDGTLRVGFLQTEDNDATGCNWYYFCEPELWYAPLDTPTAISVTQINNNNITVTNEIYSIDGKRLNNISTSGIYLIRMSDGTVRKFKVNK